MDRRQLRVVEMAAQTLARGERAALATVVRTSGSAPQEPGARLLLLADGQRVGTVGGGRIEAVVLEELKRCLDELSTTHTLRWDLTKQLGMCCGGSMEIMVELVDGGPRLWVFGAGHVGRATARLAADAGFYVIVVDDREAEIEACGVPPERRVQSSPGEALVSRSASPWDFMLIATHDHRLDEEALHAALAAPHRYVGMVASRRKTLRILRRLVDRYGPQPLDRLSAPVGLDLGGRSPEEIAVAIVAELIAVRHGRHGQPIVQLRLDDACLPRTREPSHG